MMVGKIKYKHLSIDQFNVSKRTISNSLGVSTIKLDDCKNTVDKEAEHSCRNEVTKVISSNQFEAELIVFSLKESITIHDEYHFVGDTLQFINKHLNWNKASRIDSFLLSIQDQDYFGNTVFENDQYIGTYSELDEIPFDVANEFTLRLDSNVDLAQNELALTDEWYESGLSPEELPIWLMENSDIYAKGVINFVPEEIQKQNRLKAQIQKYHQSVAVGVVALVSTLMLMFLGSFFLSSNQEKLEQQQGYLYNIRSELSEARGINSELKRQFESAESQIAGRSNHIKSISQYERLLPKSVSIKQLTISAPLDGGNIQHSIVATVKDNNDMVLLLKRLNAVETIQDVSLKKASNKENGVIQFELDIEYLADR